ncbi:MAG: toll/interleukin-1 receptor domain-containing protein [Pseudomonadota bacterium]
MKKEDQVKLLTSSVLEWNAWREANPDVFPELKQANLSGAHLDGANLDGADLGGANLRGAYLRGANLREADLRGANLRGAYLGEANLTAANLAETDLEEAHLDSANLKDAFLFRANLSGAELTSVNLSYAILDQANLAEAVLDETILGFLDLTETKGIESINHHGPSCLGVETLMGAPNLPEVFLRGCGVPDLWIEYLPSLLAKPISFYSCFISYNREDKSFARRLHDQLQGRGIRCWLDEQKVLPGDDFHADIDRALRVRDKVIVCCSEKSLASWWVRDEIGKALERERAEKKMMLIPLDLDGELFKWKHKFASVIRARQAADFTGWESNNAKFEEQFELVVKALRTQRPPDLEAEE